ncbi:hypothetical protein EON80_17760 [bacterium]|nr:MAG: hypothetical protein EON80_17760 [bacterium]
MLRGRRVRAHYARHDARSALLVAEDVRRAVEETAWPKRAVTASFGVATTTQELRDESGLIATADAALGGAQSRYPLRGDDSILKVSRSIADFEEAGNIEMHHVAEAINYRAFERRITLLCPKASV